MQCEACGEYEANVHLTHVVNGTSREINLCEGCAAKHGINVNGAMSLTDILVGLGALEEVEDAGSVKACPSCHLTLGELRKGARMGCASCYEVFGAELKPMLADMQKGTKHAGKVPVAEVPVAARDVRLEAMQRELEEAVSKEDFETAARIRDEIRDGKTAAGLGKG
ncbi:MAG: UvrB/UvrC motif-containing protein [bacterium]